MAERLPPRSGQPGRAGRAAPRDRELAARLAHDVGKYLARTARNLPADGGERLEGPLLAMLVTDLYGAPGGVRPRQRFTALAAELVAAGAAPRPLGLSLDEVAQALARLDALEAGVRAGEGPAVAEARQLALAIEQRLRELASARGPRGGG
ncbi:MAG: hypothetical protein U1A78_03460 [Polyangia bacterium]